MNPTAIYSKTGKGVQEASGKTSLLKRPDRAVLSAIDGRATLGDVAQKCGKPFDADFQKLVQQLDKDGFIREVSAGVAPAAPKGAAPAAKAPPPKPAAPAKPADAGEDLDFSSFAAPAKPAAPPPRPAAPPPPPPRPAVPPPPPPRPAAPPPPRPAAPPPPPPRPAAPPPPPPRPAAPPPPAAKAPSSPQSALDQAREEAEARAAAEKEKQKAQAEGRPTADAEAKLRAEAEAKIKAAREVAVRMAAEAKMKADAEAKRGREEAEKARRESEELKKRLEEETKAREEAERKARDEAERARKELEGERKRLEEDRKKQDEESRKRREEEENKAEEDRTARRKREDVEEQERRRKREEEERKAEDERAARRKREEEEEKELQRKKDEERRKHEEEEKELKRKKDEERRKHEEEERKIAEERAARRKREAEEEERKAEEERAARKKKREEEEARVRAEEEDRKRLAEEERVRREAEEEAERQRLAAEEDRRKSQAQKSIAEMTPPPSAPAAPAAGGLDSMFNDLESFGKKDDEEAKSKAEAERKARADAEKRSREEEERRAAEEHAAQRRRAAEEEERRAEEERAARKKKREEEEQREDEERKAREKKRREQEEAEIAEAEAKKSKGKKAPPKAAKDDIPDDDDAGMDEVKSDQKAMAGGKKKEKAYVAPRPVPPSMRREKRSWGKPITLTLFLLLALGIGGVHVMPLGTADYERAASEALGRPVKIGSGRMWLFSGLQLRLQNVTIGDFKVASVTAFPTFDSLSNDRKAFTRIDLDGVTLPQQALAEVMAAKVKGDKFSVARVVVHQMELTGPLPLPKNLEADIALDAEGAASSITVRGPDSLVAKLTPKGSAFEFDVSAGGFTIPIAPDVTLGTFGMKGTATRQGMSVAEWDGTFLNGRLTGTANVRWGANWTVDGVMTARGINAAVFAPALISEGRGEGTAKFSLSGPDPMAIVAAGRYDANFKVETGALGGVDLSRAIRTSARETAGRTPFHEMTGQLTYDRGVVAARNVQITEGQLNAAISADITKEGALSGRIIADVRAGSQTLRATVNLGGTARDPQFRN